MKLAQKGSGRAMSMPGGIAFGEAVSLTVTLLGAALLAKLVESEKMAEENIGYGVMVILVLASFAGAAVASRKIKHQHLLVCSSAGVVYMASLLAMTALFFGGQYSGVGVTALLVLCGTGLAVFAAGPREGKRRGKIRIPNR